MNLPQDGLPYVDIERLSHRASVVVMRGDAYLPKEAASLNQSQQYVWQHLRHMYKLMYMVMRPYNEAAADAPFMFNEVTWGRIILGLAKGLENRPRGCQDCWHHGGRIDSSGYPQIRVTPGRIESRGNQGTRFFSTVPETNRPLVKVAKLAWVLGHPSKMDTYTVGDRSSQTDHQCESKLCFNPWHLSTATDQENKSRHYCRYGCAALCPHEPRCLFSDPTTGISLRCLNSTDAGALSGCTCSPSCQTFIENRRSLNNSSR